MEFWGQLSLTQRSSNIRQKLTFCWASLIAQLVKNLSAMQETWVQSLGWADPLEKEKATHSSILAWEVTWTEEHGRLQSMQFSRPEYWNG